MDRLQRPRRNGIVGLNELSRKVARAARPLQSEADLDPLLERIGNARVVMLGEATHGTSEFYRWRTRISQRLVTGKGFDFIAVEGDWPDCYRVNRFVKGYPGSPDNATEVLQAFERWPTWMWGNWEVAALASWLRDHNRAVADGSKAGFYGLDVYSLWESLEAVMNYLQRSDPDALDLARRAYLCFEPYRDDEQAYAQATAFVPQSCEDEVVALLDEIRRRAPAYPGDDEARLSVEQNARSIVGAERYYRTMMRGSRESWNGRDEHMMDTLDNLLEEVGKGARAIVWAHNTHVGDARATDMAQAGMTNLGQLARERYGEEDVVLVGFASYQGSVIAGEGWGANMEQMLLPPARESSWESVLHIACERDALLLSEDLPEAAEEWRDHRAVGVVYDPARERFGNYVPTRLPERYDALLYIDRSTALHPLHLHPDPEGSPETYPWGV